MRVTARTIVPAAVAIAILASHAAYWSAVWTVLGSPDGRACGYWSSGGPGRLLPWPEPPGPLAVITPMYPWDVPVCVAYETGLFLAIASATAIAGWILTRALLSPGWRPT